MISRETQFILEHLGKMVCEAHGVNLDNLRSERRGKEIVDARKDFIAFASQMGFKPVEIGNYINKDRTAVLYHLRRGKCLRQEL